MSCSYRGDSEKLQPDKLHGFKPIPHPLPYDLSPPRQAHTCMTHPLGSTLWSPLQGASQDCRFFQDCPVPRALSAPKAKHSQAKIQAPPPQGTAARRVSQPHMFRA